MSDTYRLFVGVDWASTSHQVCVIDADRRILAERVVEQRVGSWIRDLPL